MPTSPPTETQQISRLAVRWFEFLQGYRCRATYLDLGLVVLKFCKARFSNYDKVQGETYRIYQTTTQEMGEWDNSQSKGCHLEEFGEPGVCSVQLGPHPLDPAECIGSSCQKFLIIEDQQIKLRRAHYSRMETGFQFFFATLASFLEINGLGSGGLFWGHRGNVGYMWCPWGPRATWRWGS